MRFWILLALGLTACGPNAEIDGALYVPTAGGALTRQDGGTRTSTPSTRRDAGPRDASPIDAGDPRCPDPTLESIRERVLIPSCATSGCHTGANPSEGLALDGMLLDLASRLRQSAHQSPSGMPLITAGEPGASYLYLKAYLATPPSGDRMPADAPLEACQLSAIRRWIEAGAP